jgi:hypothetical protein
MCPNPWHLSDFLFFWYQSKYRNLNFGAVIRRTWNKVESTKLLKFEVIFMLH